MVCIRHETHCKTCLTHTAIRPSIASVINLQLHWVPWVDEPVVQISLQGTKNLVAAAVQAKVKKFVLVTSIGVDDTLFPLNLFFGVSR